MAENLTTETRRRRGTRLRIADCGLQIYRLFSSSPFLPFFFALCLCVSAVSLSCTTKPTNLRALAPADTLIYLETNDLAAAIQPIIDNKSFAEVAKRKPDLSALRGVQLAVAVTGFETKEEKLTEENSIGRVQPHFAAIADTHAWGWQTRNFAENQLGEFINNVYGGGVNLEVTDKNGGKYYVWTAEDKRKAYAFVQDSLIFFGNDESSIERCLAVKRGEADSILENPKLPAADPNALASGYISTDGVAQIANIAGLAVAAGTGEEEGVKSFIAGVLPKLLRSSVSELTWTAAKTERGIEDKWLISTAPDVTNVFSETLSPSGQPDVTLFEDLPSDLPSVTLYNIKEPQVAWRSLLLVARKQTDPLAGRMIGGFSGILLEPYGVRDVEMFTSAIGPTIVTAKLDADGEKPVLIARIKDRGKVRLSLLREFKPPKPEIGEQGVEVWTTTDGDLSAAYIGDEIILGDTDFVNKCVSTDRMTVQAKQDAILKRFGDIRLGAAVTVGTDSTSAAKIAAVLGGKKSEEARAASSYMTETRFTKNGIERRTVSDFGLIGSIIAQLAPED